MVWTESIAVGLVLLLAYIYAGYPALLWIASRIFPRRHGFDAAYQPSVTLIVSAYNEADVIAEKIENSLALDYPKEKLTVMVVSDCSSDGTDEIALSYAPRGVVLVRATERRGKTAALNEAMERIASDLVVFSDANAMYDKSAIRFLAGHFADPRVGYAVGHARYREETETAAGGSEGAYWNVEVFIKDAESRLCSVVGGDGAIYAIRRPLYEPMQETDINDFVNPLQIVAKGFRGIFDARAWCIEQPAGEFGKEFSRKVRIANRSFNAVLRVPQALNPLRVGAFAWLLLSHKVLRWFSPFILCALLLDLVVHRCLEPPRLPDRICAAACCSLLALAAVGWLLREKKGHPLFSLPYYFVLMNIAAAEGILLRLSGKTISTWSTVRQAQSPEPVASSFLERLGLCGLLLLFPPVLVSLAPEGRRLECAAFLLLALLCHAYLLYPALLLLLRRFVPKRIDRDEEHLPEVTLLIAAYNEERHIEQKLSNSLLLDYPAGRLHIVVASDGSTDRTNEIVGRYLHDGVSLCAYSRNRGKIAALSDAMKGISSEIVVMSDANVTYDPCAIRKLVRHFKDGRVGAVSGKVILVNDSLSYRVAENGYYNVEHFIQEHEGALGALIGADGAMYAIRRTLFRSPPPDTILDDLVIPLDIARRGYLVLHDKEALGWEANQLELAGEFRRKARIIAGGYQCLLRPSAVPGITRPLLLFCFMSHKVLRWLSGFLVLGLLAVLLRIQGSAGAQMHLLFTATLALLLFFMCLAVLVQLFPFLRGFRISNYSHYFFMLMAASLFGCYLGVTGRQKVAWRGGAS